MTMATLNNNAVASVLNAAIAQATGASAVASLDLRGIVDQGNDPNVIGSVEQFTKALVNVLVKNWFTDTSYRSNYSDPFFIDEEEFGAITQLISVEVPQVQASHEWTSITSGTTTAGEYTLFLPVVDTAYYGKSVSWEIPICITGNQWDTAFRSEAELRGFVAYVLMCVDNALVVHLQDMDFANRNNFIIEKAKAQANALIGGIHVVDLLGGYYAATGKTGAFSVDDFLADRDALIYASEQIALYKDYFGTMSTCFNTKGKKRFTPDERLVLQVLAAFEKKVQFNALSNIYNDELAALPGHQTVPYWQGFGKDASNGPTVWSEVSKVVGKTYGDADAADPTTVSNIVAVLADKWAIMHTIISRRVAAKVFEPENLTQYYYQFTDRYLNDLSMNGVIFVLTPVAGE